MPLTRLQQGVLHVLAALRSEESHFAGGLVLNSSEDSPSFSHDFDIFHDAEAEVARASNADVAALRAAGYDVHEALGDWRNPTGFRKARLAHLGKALDIDGAVDAAFRFFPIEPDP